MNFFETQCSSLIDRDVLGPAVTTLGLNWQSFSWSWSCQWLDQYQDKDCQFKPSINFLFIPYVEKKRYRQ